MEGGIGNADEMFNQINVEFTTFELLLHAKNMIEISEGFK